MKYIVSIIYNDKDYIHQLYNFIPNRINDKCCFSIHNKPLLIKLKLARYCIKYCRKPNSMYAQDCKYSINI
jgi:hypothetical protein